MAKFNSAVITTKGKALIAKVQAGTATMQFTKVQTGNGSYTGTEILDNATALKSMKQEFNVSSITIENTTTVKLRTLLSNEGLTEGYYITEIGLFAQDPTEGPILYSITTAFKDKWDYFPAYDSNNIATITLENYATVAAAASTTIKAGTGALALAEDVSKLGADVSDFTTTFNGLLATIVYNVNTFGAKGDGVTDDYAAIMSAYNSLISAGGGILYFPKGIYMISQTIILSSNLVTIKGANRNASIIKALNAMDKMMSVSNLINISAKNISIHGNNLAQVGLYTYNTGMLNLDDVQALRCLDKGIFLDHDTWMFNLTNTYTLYNTNYGIYIADNCAGSSMRLVVSEENGINLRIGYTRMIGIRECTFQRFTTYGNVLIQGGWDITLDTNWFEPPRLQAVPGDTYDLKLDPVDPVSGGIGHTIRVLNNSFVGGSTYFTKYCILDNYSDTILTGNYIDGSNGGYTNGKWYIGSLSDARTIGFGNEIIGGLGFTITTFAIWHKTLGTSADRVVRFSQAEIDDKLYFLPKAGEAYTYDGYIYNNTDRHCLHYSEGGRYWDIPKQVTGGAAPTSGMFRRGDICKNTTPSTGNYIGWVCTVDGTPGTWAGYGLIS